MIVKKFSNKFKKSFIKKQLKRVDQVLIDFKIHWDQSGGLIKKNLKLSTEKD